MKNENTTTTHNVTAPHIPFDPLDAQQGLERPAHSHGPTDAEMQRAELDSVREKAVLAARERAESLQRFDEFERTVMTALIDGFSAISTMLADSDSPKIIFRGDKAAIKYDTAAKTLKEIDDKLRAFIKKP